MYQDHTNQNSVCVCVCDVWGTTVSADTTPVTGNLADDNSPDASVIAGVAVGVLVSLVCVCSAWYSVHPRHTSAAFVVGQRTPVDEIEMGSQRSRTPSQLSHSESFIEPEVTPPGRRRETDGNDGNDGHGGNDSSDPHPPTAPDLPDLMLGIKIDTTGDGVPDSVMIDTTDDGTPNMVIPLNLDGSAAGSDLHRSSQGHGDGTCVCCMDMPAKVVLVPCGHMCVCESCGVDLKRRRMACPMCRSTVKAIQKVFTCG